MKKKYPLLNSFRRIQALKSLVRISVVALIASMPLSAYGQLRAKITPTAKQALEAAFPSAAIKVAFICQDTLRFVDFSEASPQIYTMKNVVSAYFPVISSDGKWVNYQTGIEAEGPSSSSKVGIVWMRELAANGTPIKIADTGYVPRFVQNTSVDSPEIIYSTSVTCPGSICYNNGQTLKKKIVNKVPQAAQVVFNGGSYYGGLSYDGRFLNTGWPGGPNAFMLDLNNSAVAPHPVHTMRVKKNVTLVDTFVSIGTCNISRSASSIFTNTMLFYDFSSMAITSAGCFHPLLGTWATHAKLFISRYDGEDLRVFDMPADRPLTPSADAQGKGEAVGKEWYNPEWSNHPYVAAASLLVDRLFSESSGWEHTTNCESIYLVNLKDSAYIKLAQSDDSSYTSKINLTYPFLWVDAGANFHEDSTWLKYTIWERALQPIRFSGNNKKQINAGSLLYKAGTISSLTLYSLAGRKIAAVAHPEKLRGAIGQAFPYVRAGSYFLEIKTIASQKEYIRWVVTH